MPNDFDFLPGIDSQITPYIRGVQVTNRSGHVRDRFNNLLPFKPGDYVILLGDGSMTVFTERAAEATDSDYDGIGE